MSNGLINPFRLETNSSEEIESVFNHYVNPTQLLYASFKQQNWQILSVDVTFHLLWVNCFLIGDCLIWGSQLLLSTW